MSRSNDKTPLEFFLNDLRSTIFWTYENFNEFLIAAEEMPVRTITEIKNDIEKWNDNNPKSEFSGFEIHEDNLLRVEHFVNHFDNASMILAFSKFELTLYYICDQLREHFKIEIKRKDLKGKGITQASFYLQTFFKIDENDLAEWKEIERFRDLRNLIVHNNSHIEIKEENKLTDSHIYQNTKKITGCSVDDDGKVSIDKTTVKRFAELSLDTLDEICRKINK